MSRRAAYACLDCRALLGRLHGPVLELAPGVAAEGRPGGAAILCPACGAQRLFHGKVILVVSEALEIR